MTKLYIFVLLCLLTLGLLILNIQSLKRQTLPPIPTRISTVPSVIEYTVITETPVPSATPRPSATVTPTPNRISAGDLEAFFSKYAEKESVDRDLLKKIAVCESGFNPAARNGIYGGLFQFSENSWQSLRRIMNLDTNPALRFNAEEAIKTAAYKLALNGRAAWPNCSQ
ncbi:hypothetical protein A3J20_03000 [Candidatus Gottesmanbacteria bacterium RIFCSPLOWO2_02_FULL_42_29]|uniref:Resuscitation-promoting factor core lysozyme-like domain-containing protein n=2 Tax=Candidatus Gottesmaniibacteriota TaxID=1752720 RepID=A0A1F6B8V1_9BACT|nr:MAG: Protein containing Lytic transglycosylase-like, catalytic-like protein [Candidatus Gottesmanbacteria bacterium GW2011_GWA2_42_18]KKS75919.1 MAG: Protein containing Lytic transglycosylase-like, catalytic-like protein [Candidatus Gottesmanbacteria bacterium GW2011_GWC2_42_8]OGG10834.1 MAG: hypothetical protein A2781_01895 [Candidatus Gottesmanbacteria bacterium RIFCSPHIGHO2_01_FULL_42_27]OGG19504.1 MAG: hypothetical protein A3E72_06985 [Candidatus Gottesmanbacteria bacterium RIFCSPHIGHO2_1